MSNGIAGIKSKNIRLTKKPEIKIFQYSRELNSEWDSFTNSTLLSKAFLGAIEQAAPNGMTFRYIVVIDSDSNQILASFYCQILHFNAARSLGLDEDCPKDEVSFFCGVNEYFKRKVAGSIDFYTIVCGNLLLTGPYGWRFNEDVDSHNREIIMENAINALRDEMKSRDMLSPAVTLVKEFYPHRSPSQGWVKKGKWHRFRIQPNLIMEIRPEWSHFGDYLAALSSKYRIRYRRALKKLSEVCMLELSAEEILSNQHLLYQLYLNIARNVGFNMTLINESYLYAVKSALGEKFKVIAFIKNDKIVGFYSYFVCEENVEAHFIGLDAESNKEHQLYLNMLYQLLETAFTTHKKSLVLGRTANEIKSSIGAVALEMDCFIRHRSKLYQKFTPGLIDYLQPKASWQARSPFSEPETNTFDPK
jgi:hypothetical protein